MESFFNSKNVALNICIIPSEAVIAEALSISQDVCGEASANYTQLVGSNLQYSLTAVNVDSLLKLRNSEGYIEGLKTILECPEKVSSISEVKKALGSLPQAAPHKGFPHITLAQLIIPESAIGRVIKAAQKGSEDVSIELEILKQLDKGPVFDTLQDMGVRLSSISLSGDSIINFQKKFAKTVFNEVQDVVISAENTNNNTNNSALANSFLDSWSGNEKSIEWVTRFFEANNFGSNPHYRPHITLGSSCLTDLSSFKYTGPLKLRYKSLKGGDSVLAVCQMGNFCSCGRILSVF